MGVDIVDIFRVQAGLAQRHLHGTERARTFRMWRRHVIGIAGQAITDHFAINLGTARLGPLIFFQHHHASAFAHHETIAILIIGAAGAGGIVVEIGRKRAGLGETGDAQRAQRTFRTAGQHHIGIIQRDHAGGIANGMGAGGAGGDNRVVGAHQAIFDRNLARDEIDQPTMHEMRRHAARALFVQHD